MKMFKLLLMFENLTNKLDTIFKKLRGYGRLNEDNIKDALREDSIALASKPPTIIMMVGLQGSGKTTTSAKLARRLLKEGQLPLLVAADVYRPAAIEPLNILRKE